jgi:hypothetical protein
MQARPDTSGWLQAWLAGRLCCFQHLVCWQVGPLTGRSCCLLASPGALAGCCGRQGRSQHQRRSRRTGCGGSHSPHALPTTCMSRRCHHCWRRQTLVLLLVQGPGLHYGKEASRAGLLESIAAPNMRQSARQEEGGPSQPLLPAAAPTAKVFFNYSIFNYRFPYPLPLPHLLRSLGGSFVSSSGTRDGACSRADSSAALTKSP